MIKPPSVNVILRQSPDWKTITEEQFLSQCGKFCNFAKLPFNLLRNSHQVWSDTFNKSYFEVRQELKEIASKSLSRIQNAEIVHLVDITEEDIEENSFYAFIDDDDWFSPDLGDTLKSSLCGKNPDLITWDISVYDPGGPPSKDFFATPGTNNYAISGSTFLKRFKTETCYSQHWNVLLETFEKRVHFPYCLSIYNRSPTSASSFFRMFSNEYSKHCLLSAVELYVTAGEKSKRFPKSCDWGEEYADKTLEVFKNLLLNRR